MTVLVSVAVACVLASLIERFILWFYASTFTRESLEDK